MKEIFLGSIMPRMTRRRQTRRAKRNAVARVARAVSQAYMIRRNPLYGQKYKKRASNGFFTVVRKLPVITFQSSAVAGLYNLTDPTGTCLSLGTPTAAPGSSTTYDIPFSLKFSLNQLLSHTDITQIADQYKILSVMVKVSSGYQVATGLATQVPFIEYIQDYDDATVPNINIIRTKMGVRTKYFGPNTNVLFMGVRPKFAQEVFSSGITTGYGARKGWLDCNNDSVEHYGIKGIFHNVALPAISNNATFTLDISFNVAAKDLQ